MVLHAAVLPDDLFIQREADGLRYSPGYLTLGQPWMENLADLLQGDKVVDGDTVSGQVDRHLRDVDSPGEGSIGFAAVFLIVPENSGRSFIPGERLELAVLFDVLAARLSKFVVREVFGQVARGFKRPDQAHGGRANQVAYDHSGA